MAVASEAAEFVQDRIYYLVEYGTFLLEADKIQDALRVFASCLALNPHSVQALYHMGFSLMKEGRIQEADTFFQKALRLDPKSIEAHNNAASCRIQSMDFSRALWHYDAILKIDPQFLPARIGRACVLFEKGDASEGIALLEALVLEHPENPKILFNLSLCRERAGQIPLAIEGYRAVLKLSPSGSGEAKQALDALKALASQGDLPTG